MSQNRDTKPKQRPGAAEAQSVLHAEKPAAIPNYNGGLPHNPKKEGLGPNTRR